MNIQDRLVKLMNERGIKHMALNMGSPEWTIRIIDPEFVDSNLLLTFNCETRVADLWWLR